LKLDKVLDIEFLPLSAAGQYREYEVPVSLDGHSKDFTEEAAVWGEADWVSLRFSGLVEDERVVAAQEEELERRFQSGVRKLEIHRDDVAVLPGIATEPLARRFLRLWQDMEPEDDRDDRRKIWLRARELALEEIKRVLEARQ
jgi:hypothetical protein